MATPVASMSASTGMSGSSSSSSTRWSAGSSASDLSERLARGSGGERRDGRLLRAAQLPGLGQLDVRAARRQMSASDWDRSAAFRM